ncbi:hypothetical protein FDP41_010510 [Naegleria fowleri]|uniref:Uncharacterized protein n=1 Tax=Naegleria fowleri TaxID=5763 RepID=A0A6A5CDL9_NAEFO|nr:uncharacterized protein FDP41_010510 [Naegleria fowleri]KAF0983445.1 hypothetical protein FDP41_010510 [Naegleria fowleri]
MKSSIDLFSSALNVTGPGIEKNIVRNLGSIERVSVYDYSTSTVANHKAPSKLVSFQFNDTSVLSKTIDYGIGIANYASLGISLLILLIVQVLFLGVTSCYATCSMCCCKPSKKDRELRMKDHAKWAFAHNKKKRVTTCCRVFLLVLVIFNILALLVWFLFAFQTNIQFSQLFNQGLMMYNEVESLAQDVLKFAGNLPTIIDLIEQSIGNLKKNILNKLPSDVTKQSWSNCISNMISQVPDLSTTSHNVDTLNSYISTQLKTPLTPLKTSISGLKSSILSISNIDIPELINQLTNTESALTFFNFDPLLTSITSSQTTLQQINYINSIKNSLQIVSDERANTLTDAFLSNLAYNLQNYNTDPNVATQTLATQLSTLSTSLTRIKASNFNQSLGYLNALNTSLSSVTASNSLITLINNLENSLNALETPLNNSIVRVDMLDDALFTTIPNALTSIKTSVTNFNQTIADIPSLQNIIDTMDIINSFVTLFNGTNCIDSILTDLSVINATIVEVPLADIQAKYRSVKDGIISKANGALSSLFRDLKNTIKASLPNVTQQVNQFYDSKLDYGPSVNITDLWSLIPLKTFRTLNTSLNLRDLLALYSNFDSARNSLSDFSALSHNLSPLDNSINVFDLNEVGQIISTLQTAPSTCAGSSDPACTGLSSVMPSLATLVSNLQNALIGMPSLSSAISSLTSAQTLISSTLSSLSPIKSIIVQMRALKNSFKFSQARNSLSNDFIPSLHQVTNTIPFQSIVDSLDSLQKSLNSLDLSSLSSQISSMSPTFSHLNNMDVSSYLNSLNTSTIDSALNFASMFSTIKSMVNGLNIASYSWYVDEANHQLNDIFLPDLFAADGYRLLAVVIFISLILFIPWLAVFPVCFPKCPSVLLVVTMIMSIFVLLACVAVALLLPLNIALVDTCDRVEEYAFLALHQYGGSSMNGSIAFSQEFMGFKFNISIIPSTTIKSYMQSQCDSDVMNITLTQVESVAQALPSFAMNYLKKFLGSLVVRDQFVSFITTSLQTTVDNVFDQVRPIATILSCARINSYYKHGRNLVCQDISGFLANFWFLFALLALLFLFDGYSFIIMYIVFRTQWYDKKASVGQAQHFTQDEAALKEARLAKVRSFSTPRRFSKIRKAENIELEDV